MKQYQLDIDKLFALLKSRSCFFDQDASNTLKTWVVGGITVSISMYPNPNVGQGSEDGIVSARLYILTLQLGEFTTQSLKTFGGTLPDAWTMNSPLPKFDIPAEDIFNIILWYEENGKDYDKGQLIPLLRDFFIAQRKKTFQTSINIGNSRYLVLDAGVASDTWSTVSIQVFSGGKTQSFNLVVDSQESPTKVTRRTSRKKEIVPPLTVLEQLFLHACLAKNMS